MTLRWKNGKDNIPVQVECEQVGFPHPDADGEQQFVNTHFDSQEEAWEHGQRDLLAGISLTGGEIEHLEAQLRARQQEAGQLAVQWKHFSYAYEKFRHDKFLNPT